MNVFKTLEIKISEIHNLSNDRRIMQIKGNKQLVNLTQSVKPMSEKFEKFKKDCEEKEKIKSVMIMNSTLEEIAY